ncbi:MAG: PspA/IM30 family protein [Thermoleophilia bacterium]|nr:PspA/IM30 family protein [Thermoleophilia bacterium]
MGLISRLTHLIKAWVSELIGSAEDPGVTLDYSYERQRALLQDVKRGVADVVTAKKRIQLQSAKLEQTIAKLEEQARKALAAGREDLARTALERKAFAQQQLRGLDEQAANLERQQQKLVASEQRLAAKVEAFRTQKEVLKAEYSAAEAQARIGEAATGIGEEMAEVGLAIERTRDRTEQLQARSAALDELVEAGTLEDFTATGTTTLDRELEKLDMSEMVEADMARLRGEVGAGQQAAVLEQEVPR